MNLQSIIILAVVLIAAVFVCIRIKRNKSGCPGCTGNCAGCPGCHARK